MARRVGIVFAAVLLASVVLPASAAVAGGGCHSGATQGTGDTVEMMKACFTPSLLRIDPGDSVTFVNRDPVAHNVSANGWGYFDDLLEGDAFTATFEAPGVYPFACSYHPGMTGAVVVGDGIGAGNGETVLATGLQRPEPALEVRTVTEPASSAPVVLGWTLGAAIGIGLGFGIGALVRRSRRSAA